MHLNMMNKTQQFICI